MKYILVVSFIIGCTSSQRCYKGFDKINDEYFLVLNSNNTFEMSVLSKFHNESNLFEINGLFNETDSTIVLDKYFDEKSVEFKKVGKKKIEIKFLYEVIQLKQIRYSN